MKTNPWDEWNILPKHEIQPTEGIRDIQTTNPEKSQKIQNPQNLRRFEPIGYFTGFTSDLEGRPPLYRVKRLVENSEVRQYYTSGGSTSTLPGKVTS